MGGFSDKEITNFRPQKATFSDKPLVELPGAYKVSGMPEFHRRLDLRHRMPHSITTPHRVAVISMDGDRQTRKISTVRNGTANTTAVADFVRSPSLRVERALNLPEIIHVPGTFKFLGQEP